LIASSDTTIVHGGIHCDYYTAIVVLLVITLLLRFPFVGTTLPTHAFPYHIYPTIYLPHIALLHDLHTPCSDSTGIRCTGLRYIVRYTFTFDIVTTCPDTLPPLPVRPGPTIVIDHDGYLQDIVPQLLSHYRTLHAPFEGPVDCWLQCLHITLLSYNSTCPDYDTVI